MPTLILSVSGARGIVGDGLDEGVAARLALAFARTLPLRAVVLGRDPRPSGVLLARAVARALASLGCAVTDLGVVPTPTVQLAVETRRADGGIVVTASHNPLPWNALKFVGADGAFLGAPVVGRLIETYRALPQQDAGAGDAGQAEAGPRTTGAGREAVGEHVARILRIVDAGAVRRAGLGVVVDGVRGAGSVLLGPLFEALGVAVDWVDGEPDGRLPDHPEPRAERLEPLLARVRRAGADLGFALDPDGDRCAVLTAEAVLGEEWTLPLAAWERLEGGARGPLVANWSTSSRVEWVAERFGVPLHRTPVGEAHVVARMREVGALLGGEGNGGVIDPAVHLGRDAGVAVARLLALEARGPGGRGGVSASAGRLPPRALVKRAVPLERDRLAAWGERLRARWGEPTHREDGWYWRWPGSWVHVRPSGTEPIVRLFAEAASEVEAGSRVAEAEREADAVRG
jgi:phosphomannomutase